MTSPVGGLFMAMQQALGNRQERMFLDDGKKMAILKGIVDGYYHDMPKNKIVFDTNRLWTSKMSALVKLFPQSKVICCVRDVPWIIDSVERLIQKNPFDISGIFGFTAGGNVHTRIDTLTNHTGLLGNALENLQEAFFGEHAKRLILIDYEALARAPYETLQHIYDFIGEPWFDHDFDNVLYEAEQFDFANGTPGLHAVRTKVEWSERQTVLPPGAFDQFKESAFWTRRDLNPRDVKIVLPGKIEYFPNILAAG